jgi:VIT1/CCC1 family predicted Fe2+/Mn2+ transporter
MKTTAKMKVLRSVFLDPEMDEALRQAAFRLKVSKGELIRTYVERGLASGLQNSITSAAVKDQVRAPSKRAARQPAQSRKAVVAV